MNNQKTNWRYLIIIIILGFIIGGGILGYQYWWFKKEVKQLGMVRITLDAESQGKKFPGVQIDDLKEGVNQINGFRVEKIKPRILCEMGNNKEWESTFVGYTYLPGYNLGNYYELTCNIEGKAKIKMMGPTSKPGNEKEKFSINVDRLTILDEQNNIIDQRGEKEGEIIEFYEDKGRVEIFHYNNKTYFLIHGGIYGNKTGNSQYFLYVVDSNDKIKPILHWWCDVLNESCDLNYAITYEEDLYLKVGEEIWDIGANDILNKKLSASKIIIQNGEILFQ